MRFPITPATEAILEQLVQTTFENTAPKLPFTLKCSKGKRTFEVLSWEDPFVKGPQAGRPRLVIRINGKTKKSIPYFKFIPFLLNPDIGFNDAIESDYGAMVTGHPHWNETTCEVYLHSLFSFLRTLTGEVSHPVHFVLPGIVFETATRKQKRKTA